MSSSKGGFDFKVIVVIVHVDIIIPIKTVNTIETNAQLLPSVDSNGFDLVSNRVVTLQTDRSITPGLPTPKELKRR
jgi:hypothetical protein